MPRNTRVLDSIDQIGEASWKHLEPSQFPFASYQYLSALEKSACVGNQTNWKPQYVTSWDGSLLNGAIIAYLKLDSYGEYIFDFGWAQAYQANRLNYYPKLLSAIPFTPATGPKILLKEDADESVVQDLLNEFEILAKNQNVSSIHALFLETNELKYFEKADYKIRHSFQFHWKNQNYKNFQDFLDHFKSKRRKEIIRERRKVSEANLKIVRLTGNEIKKEHALIMYEFYRDTIHKMGGHSYLNQNFFLSVFEDMKDQILVVLAADSNDRFVAGALNFFTSEKLFGRYWGCLEDYKALHFELCYYQTIEFAIQKEIKMFEAGAQGEHKFQRGFLPSLTYSAHKIFDPRFASAISNFIDEEKKQLELVFKDYREHDPFSYE